MRRAIDRRSRQFKDVLLDDSLRKHFLSNAPKNDAKVVKAFVAANAENALKTRPKVSLSDLFLLDACLLSSMQLLLHWFWFDSFMCFVRFSPCLALRFVSGELAGCKALVLFVRNSVG